MSTDVRELMAIHDSRASFYGKARVEKVLWTVPFPSSVERLYSYDTLVLHVVESDERVSMKIHGWYSATTARHICEYLRQRGYRAIPKSRIQELAGGWFDPREELEAA